MKRWLWHVCANYSLTNGLKLLKIFNLCLEMVSNMIVRHFREFSDVGQMSWLWLLCKSIKNTRNILLMLSSSYFINLKMSEINKFENVGKRGRRNILTVNVGKFGNDFRKLFVGKWWGHKEWTLNIFAKWTREPTSWNLNKTSDILNVLDDLGISVNPGRSLIILLNLE